MRSLLLALCAAGLASAVVAFPPPLTPEQPVAPRVTRQVTPQVAASGDGYAAVWSESGPDAANHLYVRRFSLSATPVDAEPIEVANDGNGQTMAATRFTNSLPTWNARIAAAGGTYVVVWSTFDTYQFSNYFLRRLSAATGAWIDPEPVPLASHVFELTLGSSNKSVLAVYTVIGQQLAMRARAIAVDSGPALRTAETTPATTAASDFSLGSNGTDFLLSWTDNACFGDPFCDYSFPYSLFVERVGADGTPLDSKPLALVKDYGLQWPSIAWNGNDYVMTWAGAFGTILAARIAASGPLTTSQRAASIVVQDSFQAQRLVATGSGLLLFTTRSNFTVGTTLDAGSLLPTGTPFTIRPDQLLRETFSLAALPNGVVVALDRVDPGSGTVERVFSRIFGNTLRRRTAR